METTSDHSTASHLQPERILVRGVNWLGDAVMTTPALMRLRQRFPAAHIAMLTQEKLKDLWLHHPAVNEAMTFVPGEGLFAVGNRLQAGNFDIAVVLPNSPRSAMEAWLARIPTRVGYARGWRNFFLTQSVPRHSAAGTMRKRSVAEIKNLVSAEPPQASVSVAANANFFNHQIHDYLQLVGALGAPTEIQAPLLEVTPAEMESARQKFGIPETNLPIFGLNAGAEYGPAKRWPIERFIAAARAIQKRTNCVWLIFGGKADQPLASEIVTAIQNSQCAVFNLAGRTSLRELCAVMKLCRVVLTNDTGPMHVAAAVGTALVVPFGSTSPELTGPGLPDDPRHTLIKSTAPCSPCFLRECPIDFRCMKGIDVESVVQAVLQRIE